MRPLFLETVLGWRDQWTGELDPVAIMQRRTYVRKQSPSGVAELTRLVREARNGRADIARELAGPICDELQMVSGVACASNPMDLYDLADVPGNDPLVVQQRFEAMSVADLAAAMAELEAIDPMDSVERDVRAMIDLLERRVFSGASYDEDVYTYHDPEDQYRVKEVRYGKPEKLDPLVDRMHNSRCRVGKTGTVMRFDVRVKNQFRTVLKLLKQTSSQKHGRGNPFLVRDRCGFKFVLKSLEDVKKFSEELCWMLEASGARVVDDGDNLTVDTGRPADEKNARSSAHYRKKQIAVRWNRRWFEFQLVLFGGYYSAAYALDEENHAVYKLRSGLKDILPLLYPANIYLDEGTWDEKEIGDLLRGRLLDNLGWNLKRRNGDRH